MAGRRTARPMTPGRTVTLAGSLVTKICSKWCLIPWCRVELSDGMYLQCRLFLEGGICMEAVIRKWGNSPALRLPSAALKAAGFALEQKVELVVSRGRIVIQPSEHVTYNLDALLADITEANAHGELSFGKPVGKEAF